MATGILTLALSLLAADPVPADVVPMNSRNFQIPLQIPEDKRARIKELLLFASSDQGTTWNQVAVSSPDKNAFVFYAPTDGLYWFNICVVDQQGNREPPDIYKSTPKQKVLVDTLKPNLRITSAERQGDEIAVAWEIQEQHPDLSTLKLEYHTPDAPAWMWYSAPVSQQMNGQARFRFINAGAVSVRMQVMDQAGNAGTDQRELPAKSNPLTPGPNAIVPAGLQNPAPTVPPMITTSSGSSPNLAGTPPAPSFDLTTSPAPAAPTPAKTVVNLPGDRQAPVQTSTLAPSEKSTGIDRSWSPASPNNYPRASPSSTDVENRYAGSSVSAYQTQAPSTRSTAPRWPGTAMIPSQITNNSQVTLDYEITKVGPSGVGSVELFLTKDEGKTWERYADDPDLKPPMTVNLPGEGVYGLRLVVSSRAGLGRRPPQPGDLPQMRVEVDLTPPAVKLNYPQPEPHRRDALALTWSASDTNLGPGPVTLQWAERSNGIWQTIATDLSNSGRYVWQLNPNLPYRVYLRLVVRDIAGNISTDETPEAVLIDLSEPEGQLLGIAGAARRP